MGLIRRIENGTTTTTDASIVKMLIDMSFRGLTPLIIVLIGALLVGIAIGGLFF
jgi:hypothetical protein